MLTLSPFETQGEKEKKNYPQDSVLQVEMAKIISLAGSNQMQRSQQGAEILNDPVSKRSLGMRSLCDYLYHRQV